MRRFSPRRLAALACCLSLLAAGTPAAAEKPELSEQDLAERCDAALRDIRTYCASDLRPQVSPAPFEQPGLRRVQAAPRPPTPGSERPTLPRSDESFSCLDARLRAVKYCYKEVPRSPGDKETTASF